MTDLPTDRGQEHGGEAAPSTPEHRTPCTDIQDVLFDYMARELGPARSDLVRQHLRRCPDCQRAAAEIQGTLDLIRRTSAEEAPRFPEHLSEDRRRRMLRAVTHPVLDWAYRHHILVSALIAAAVIAALVLYLRTVHTGRTDIPDAGVQVLLHGGPPVQPATPSPPESR